MLGSAANLLVLRWPPLLVVFPPRCCGFQHPRGGFPATLSTYHGHGSQTTAAPPRPHHHSRFWWPINPLIFNRPHSSPCFWASKGGWRKGALRVASHPPEGGWDHWGGSSPGSTRGGTSQHLHRHPERRWLTATRHSWGGASHCDQRQSTHHQISVVGQC